MFSLLNPKGVNALANTDGIPFFCCIISLVNCPGHGIDLYFWRKVVAVENKQCRSLQVGADTFIRRNLVLLQGYCCGVPLFW